MFKFVLTILIFFTSNFVLFGQSFNDEFCGNDLDKVIDAVLRRKEELAQNQRKFDELWSLNSHYFKVDILHLSDFTFVIGYASRDQNDRLNSVDIIYYSLDKNWLMYLEEKLGPLTSTMVTSLEIESSGELESESILWKFDCCKIIARLQTIENEKYLKILILIDSL